MKIIVGISGASGVIYGLRLLERLAKNPAVETHLIVTRAGEKTFFLETGKLAAEIKQMARHFHPVEDISSPLASGSCRVDAMVVAPCSIHSMCAIAAGISSNLLVRAADVTLKERRRLVLMVRESPFHLGHLRTMAALAEMGAVIAPPVPGFYNRPQTVMDIVDHSVDRVLDLLGLPDDAVKPVGRSRQMKTGQDAGRQSHFRESEGPSARRPRANCPGRAWRCMPCPRFEDVFRSLTEGRAAGAVVPIENTLAGSVHENYDHLQRFDLPIVGETSVRIVHNLIAPEGVTFS